ncbi:MAG: magnesium and cobalt transport protein CorA [Nocardioidaceae bacterium]
MIVDSALYRGGQRVPLDFARDDLGALRSACDRDNEFVWVGLHEPDASELDRVAEIFKLHPLAVEDALLAHQRPKLERYEGSLFLVLKTLWYVDAEDAVETGEINLFVGTDFVVSVRHGKGIELHNARLDLEKNAAVLDHGPSSVVYTICDRVVDGYEEVGQSLEIDVDEVEASVFSADRTNDAQRIYVLKRELAEMRRAVNPLKEPMGRLATARVPLVHEQTAPFFRDVADHLTRVSETVDSLDSLLSTAFEAHIARITVDQNEDMRKISAWVALGASGTLIAGIYGMNFANMPELGWRFGYAYSLALMVVIALVLYKLFKKTGWL